MMAEENMNVTSLDVRKKQFSTTFRGFDVHEVQTFLDIISLELEQLTAKNQTLRESVEKKESEVREIKDRESSMRKTLEGLQQILNDEKSRSDQKAKQIIREAELTASEMIAQARDELSSMQSEIQHLKRLRREFMAKLGSLVDSYRKIIEQDQQNDDAEIRLDSDVRII
ncbi:MAG: DivIVA domain-containing protein [bacterium]